MFRSPLTLEFHVRPVHALLSRLSSQQSFSSTAPFQRGDSRTSNRKFRYKNARSRCHATNTRKKTPLATRGSPFTIPAENPQFSSLTGLNYREKFANDFSNEWRNELASNSFIGGISRSRLRQGIFKGDNSAAGQSSRRPKASRSRAPSSQARRAKSMSRYSWGVGRGMARDRRNAQLRIPHGGWVCHHPSLPSQSWPRVFERVGGPGERERTVGVLAFNLGNL